MWMVGGNWSSGGESVRGSVCMRLCRLAEVGRGLSLFPQGGQAEG